MTKNLTEPKNPNLYIQYKPIKHNVLVSVRRLIGTIGEPVNKVRVTKKFRSTRKVAFKKIKGVVKRAVHY